MLIVDTSEALENQDDFGGRQESHFLGGRGMASIMKGKMSSG